MERIRVTIVHENSAMAGVAAAALGKGTNIRIVDHATSVLEAQARLGKGTCDVVLISGTLPAEPVMKLVKTIRQNYTPTKVIVLGLEDDPQAILRYIAAGASGYTVANEPITAALDQIHAVHNGQAKVSPAVAASMMTHVAKLSRLTARFEPKRTAYVSLTKRESEILDLLAQGYPNQVIADRLIIEVGTVKNHVHSILKKLNLRSRKDVATYMSFVQGRPQVDAAQSPMLM
jgi:two-component system response regulator NreC